MSEREVDINLYDTSVGIWQDDANDPSFRAEIYEGVLRLLKRLRWRVAADPHVLKHHRCISKHFRLAERGSLRVAVEVSGRCVKLEFWSERARPDNRNGRRYDFDKRNRAPYLDRVRIDLETKRILAWLAGHSTLTVADKRDRQRGSMGETAEAFLARRYAECWHTDKVLGRPLPTCEQYQTSADKRRIEHGARVWFLDRKGRILRGEARYNINNMWWVVTGRYGVSNKANHEIFVDPPADLRRKRNDRDRRAKLEAALAAAIRADAFPRAALLRQILFGVAPTFRIWSRKDSSYYRANYSGYTNDLVSAGRYTREEAEREVRRVPHILDLVMPDGTRRTAEQIGTDTARAG